MSNTRLTLVIRKDLQLSNGLLAAQASHLGDAWMRDRIMSGLLFHENEREWMKDPYVSVLSVNTREELEYLKKISLENGLAIFEWHDIIPSESLKITLRTFIGISIGPDDFDKIKTVTSNLPLY